MASTVPDLIRHMAQKLVSWAYDPDATHKIVPIHATNNALHVVDGALGIGSGAAYEQVADVSSAAALAAVPAWANRAWFQPETQPVRVRFDGTDPTASVGLVIAAGATLEVSGRALIQAAKFIETASAAKLNVQYFE